MRAYYYQDAFYLNLRLRHTHDNFLHHSDKILLLILLSKWTCHEFKMVLISLKSSTYT